MRRCGLLPLATIAANIATPEPMPEDLKRGAAYAVAAAALFALTAACIKHAAASVPNSMVVFFRSAVGLITIAPFLLARRGFAALRTQRLFGHLWRSAFGLSAMYCFFFAIGRLPLADAMLLNYSTPLYVPFIAWAWLHERPPAIVFPAVLTGLAGVALIVKPGGGGSFDPAAGLIGAISGVFAAGAMVNIRRIADTEPSGRIVFYFSLLSSAVSALPLWWTWRTPTRDALLALLACGVLATAGQLCLTRAYASARAALVGPFTYTSVIFAALLGWALWSETPDALSALGALLVILTCVLAMRGGAKTPAVAPLAED